MTVFSKILQDSFNDRTQRPAAAFWHAFVAQYMEESPPVFKSRFCDLNVWKNRPASRFLSPAQEVKVTDNVITFPKRPVLRLRI